MKPKRVALIGERDPKKKGHAGIEASLNLYHRATGEEVRFDWIRTDAINPLTVDSLLADTTGVWCVPGSPYANTAGALLAIRHARENGCAFLGTCGGFQHALMEYCATVMQRAAAHQEMDGSARDPLIVRLSCALIEVRASVHTAPGSSYEKIIGGPDSSEEFHCSYGMAPAFEPLFANTEIEFLARDGIGQVRVFAHRTHPFFWGSLFQPERRALRGELHPLVHAFLAHC